MGGLTKDATVSGKFRHGYSNVHPSRQQPLKRQQSRKLYSHDYNGDLLPSCFPSSSGSSTQASSSQKVLEWNPLSSITASSRLSILFFSARGTRLPPGFVAVTTYGDGTRGGGGRDDVDGGDDDKKTTMVTIKLMVYMKE